MSLIADALKTAQRQKQLRDSGSRPSVSPLLVPLRHAEGGFSLRSALTMVVSVIVIIGSIVVMVQRLRPKAPLPTLPAVPSPLAGTPLLSERAKKSESVRSAARTLTYPNAPRFSTIPEVYSASARPEAGAVASVTDSVPEYVAPSPVPRQVAEAPVPRRVADAPVPRQVSGAPLPRQVSDAVVPTESARAAPTPPPGALGRESSTALPQGAATPVVVSAAPSREPAAPAPGRLRVAIEQPRTSEASRLFAEALAAHRAGQLDVARPLYERVLSLTPDDADALNNLGVLLSAQRNYDRALELLRRAAVVAPNNAGTWNNIGAALREQGHDSEASAAFQHALTIDPRHQGAKVGLAQHFLATNLPSQARALLEEVLLANPNLAEAHYTLGQTLELLGDPAGAIREFSAFIRLAPPRLSEHVDRVRRHVDSLSARP